MKVRPSFRLLFVAAMTLDQAIKTIALIAMAPGQSVALLPGLGFTLSDSPDVYLAPDRLRLLVVGLLAILLLFRVRDRDRRAGDYAEAATQLIAAGVFSGVIDLLLWRDSIGLFVVALPNSHIYVSFADAAVLVGVGLFTADFAQRLRSKPRPRTRLRLPRPPALDLDRFRRGIDNVRIDVRLSPRFVGICNDLIGSALTPHLWWEPWRGAPPLPSKRSLDQFRAAYTQMLESAVHRARTEQNLNLVGLTQLSVLKHIHTQVRAHMDRLLREFRRELERSPPSSSRSVVRMSEHLISLQRRRASLNEQVTKMLIEQIQRAESGPVGELKRSLLGADAGLALEILLNPVLHAEDPGRDEFLMRHYLMLGQRAEDASHPHNLEKALLRALDCVDDGRSRHAGSSAHQGRSAPAGAELGGHNGFSSDFGDSVERQFVEGRNEMCPWLDVPENATVLLDMARSRQALRRARLRDDRDRAGKLKAHLRFQRLLLKRVERELMRSEVLTTILAAYETAELLKSVDIAASPRSIQRYLMQDRGSAEMAEKFRRIGRSVDKAAPLEAMDAAAARVRRCGSAYRRTRIHRFVFDFLAYRRDLKYARIMRSWLDQIRIMASADDIHLARINNTLYELLTPDDVVETKAAPVLGHVIIKADVRGSTAMTQELIDRGLNPASHFDINFFDPIGSLIDMFGAEKVFVEGDAVILAITERDVAGEAQLAVARACGLARSILEVVATQNLTGVRYGLPKLELGIGIAYQSGAPTYLMDSNRPIMISSAIARADRLSSCAAFLRDEQHDYVRLSRGQRIQVFHAESKGGLHDKKGATAFRYNVDGIELEPAAFEKLQAEIGLSTLDLRPPFGGAAERLHRGRYPDARGVLRNLLVREGVVMAIDRRQGVTVATKHPFYEVVLDTELLNVVERHTEDGAVDGKGFDDDGG